MSAWKFKKPRNGHFAHYCGDCKWWTFEREAGVAVIGTCDPFPQLGSEPSKTDAYDPSCALWVAR